MTAQERYAAKLPGMLERTQQDAEKYFAEHGTMTREAKIWAEESLKSLATDFSLTPKEYAFFGPRYFAALLAITDTLTLKANGF